MEARECPLVPGKDFPSPSHRVRSPYPCWVRPNPKLQVLRAIVVLNAINVVHGFILGQIPAQNAFHYDNVFENILPGRCGSGMSRRPDHDITFPVRCSASLPVIVLESRTAPHEASVTVDYMSDRTYSLSV